jgi:peptidoglycan/xylan/chitin deacetylase (PgdA/CDA1 family)
VISRGVAFAGLAAAAVYAAPAVTALAVTRRFTPSLAGVGRRRHIALTFDDGPNPVSTPQFLNLLAQQRIQATFFLLGRPTRVHKGLAAEIAAAGHEIGLHGYSHRCLMFRGPHSTYDDLARGRDIIADATGVVPQWYRPPYGVLTVAALSSVRRLGLRPVLWTNWGRDWRAAATAQNVHDTVTRSLRGGSTILLHDSDTEAAPGSWRSTLDALPALVRSIRGRGLTIGTLGAHDIPAPR